jgi:rhomboid protease GluP
LALLGAGNERVDVLGHLLGFVAGLCLGWGFAQTRKPLNHSIALQSICGILALLLIGAAWWVALFGLR